MAKPQFGTTATQAACLFEVLGTDAAKAFYRGLKANDIQIAAGNKIAARAIRQGEPILKYNVVIGFASADIAPGMFVHSHNMEFREFDRDYAYASEFRAVEMLPENEDYKYELAHSGFEAGTASGFRPSLAPLTCRPRRARTALAAAASGSRSSACRR